MTSTVSSTEPIRAALPGVLAGMFGGPVEVVRLHQLGGGASKESWAVDAQLGRDELPLLIRRMGGGVIHAHTLPLNVEHQVISVVHRSGVPVPRPYEYVADLAGRDAFVMDRIAAEGIGRRIVQREDLAAARKGLAEQMGRVLAAIHRVPLQELAVLPAQDAGVSAAHRVIKQLECKLDDAEEPHPIIEAGLSWLRRNLSISGADQPEAAEVLVHGDFRIGNLLVGPEGLAAVIDWEFAHRGHPLEDLAWPLIRSWRFGCDAMRCGGVGEAASYLAAYNESAGTSFTDQQLLWWEIAGNVRWAISCLTQARRHLSGAENNVELAVLGRLASEVELDILQGLREAHNAGQT